MLNKRFLLICLGLVLLNAAIFGQTLHHGMVYDEEKDAAVIFQDGLTLRNLKLVFIESIHFQTLWEPVSFFVCMLDAELFGGDPGPRHLVNLMLHIASTLLLFFCFFKMTAAVWPSALTASLFAVHPINVESVAWLAFHDSSLNLFFVTVSLLAYIYYTRTALRRYYLLLVLAFLGAMLACPRIMPFPFLLLFLDYWPLDRQRDNPSGAPSFRADFRIREKIPLFVIAFGFSAVMLVVKYGYPDTRSVNIEWLDIIVSYAAYVVKIFLPSLIVANRYLCPFHPSLWQIFLSAGLLLIISMFAVRMARKGRRYLLVGWLWFLFALAPAVIMNAGKHIIITERYAYLGAIGIFIMIAYGLADLVAANRLRKNIAVPMAIVLLAAFTGISWQQTRYWKDSITLLESTIRRVPDDQICHDKAGGIFLENHDVQKAIAHLQKALGQTPDFPPLHLNLGIAFLADDQTDKALRHLKKAVALDPVSAKAYHNLGDALFESGETGQSIVCYQKALDLNPAAYQTYNSLAIALASRGDIGKARYCLQKALQIHPGYQSARENLRLLREYQEK